MDTFRIIMMGTTGYLMLMTVCLASSWVIRRSDELPLFALVAIHSAAWIISLAATYALINGARA